MWFSWTENALSDLGVHDESRLFFNGGLIVGGLFNIIFALGMMRFFTRLTGKIGALLLLFASVFLYFIGVFPETAPYNLHYIVSVAFFTLLPLALLIQTAALTQNPATKKLGALTFAIALIVVIPWAIWMPLHPYKGVAIPELVFATATAIWSITMGTKLMRQTQPS